MEFFKRFFSDVEFDGREEVKVHCPFHHDTIASASVNTTKNVFRCNACNEGHSEISFLAKLNNISLLNASKVLQQLEQTDKDQWSLVEQAELWGDLEFLDKVRDLGIRDKTIEKLNLGLTTVGDVKFLAVPVYYNGVLMDVRRYNLLKNPKYPKLIGNKDAEVGMVFPYDLWKDTTDKTYIFEGEKDAIMAIEMGLNAITLTGGAGAKPNELSLNSFKDREVVICYDNDEAGRTGAENLFIALHKVAKSVKYIDISDVVSKEKEDFYDAVKLYGLDALTFKILPEHEFSDDLLSQKKNYTTIKNALDNNKIRQKITSIVGVSADYADTYALPIIATAEKVKESMNRNGNMLDVGVRRTWYFDKTRNLSQLLELIESNAKQHVVLKHLRNYLGIPDSEDGIELRINQYETVYKVKIVDSTSTDVDEANNIQLDLYTFEKLKVGTEYEIEYLILPHPDKHQKLTAVAIEVRERDAESDFRINKDLLIPLMHKGTVKERVNKLYESAKHHIAKHLNYGMWLMMDLVFNSILQINYGVDTWGALDVFIIGDTATGKSELAKGLTKLYDYGHFLSLKTSTTVGLIGGSKKEGDSLLNTIGAIPRQHKKLVVMEEFSGADQSFIKTMTDIRTTRKVHIIRVAGELVAPCNLRMITISNPLGDEKGFPKFLSTFPNGVMPLMELINNPEDVGRYDGFYMMPQITSRVNPFSIKLENEPIPKECYEHKAQWTHTRTKENVIWADGVEAHVWEMAEKLNEMFDSNFPLFGTKASLKLARFSVALASMILNVDETFENIVVTKEIVDFMVDYLISIYDNQLFKLREYKEEYDSFNNYTDEDVRLLEELYPKNVNIIEYLEKTSVTSLESLRANSGLDGKDFNVLYSTLSKYKFIRNTGKTIMPTTKFRKSVQKIDRSYTTTTGKIEVKGLTYKIGEEE